MTQPSRTQHTVRYTQGIGDPSDPRLISKACERNTAPLTAALAAYFEGQSGTVLEFGSGTGQHGVAFQQAFPGLTWISSDPDPVHRASVLAWAKCLSLPADKVFDLDGGADWAANPDLAGRFPLRAIYCCNVIHISPARTWMGIFDGAAKTLEPGGEVIFYGPFKRDGAHTANSNQSFDDGLRAENPKWGVRNLEDLCAYSEPLGFGPPRITEMPANNLLVSFKKSKSS